MFGPDDDEDEQVDESKDDTCVDGDGVEADEEHMDDPDVLLRDCVDTMSDHLSGAEVCAQLGFEKDSRWHIVRLHDQMIIGHLRLTFEGRTMQCKCESHRDCKLLTQLEGEFSYVDALLTRWVIAGTVMSHDRHRRLAEHVREIVRVRRGR